MVIFSGPILCPLSTKLLIYKFAVTLQLQLGDYINYEYCDGNEINSTLLTVEGK